MKASKWWKEIPLFGIILCPVLVYYWLKPLLPALIPTHYTIAANGEWVVDGRMSPAGNVIFTVIISVIVYVSISLPVLLIHRDQQSQPWIKPLFYWLKVGCVLLISGISVGLMLKSAGKLTATAAATWAYIGGIGMLVLLNGFIYRMYDVIYKRSDPKPLGRTAYNIIWASSHVVSSIGPICMLLAGHVDTGRMIIQAILLFLAISGNLMYSVRPNHFFGIRTPWTLKNDTVWRETHRLGGVLMFVLGLTGFIATFFTNREQQHIVMLTLAATAALVPTIYSYIRYRKLTHQP